jgi:uncharacterized protein YneR
MREQIWMDTIKDYPREEVLAQDNFFLDNWNLKTIDLGQHADDREVVLHALMHFDKYYHIAKFPDHVFKDREMMIEYVMRKASIVECGLYDEAVPKLKEFQDTPEFFGAVLGQYIEELTAKLNCQQYPQSAYHGLSSGESFPITGFYESGFTGHIPHAAHFLQRYAKVMGDNIIEGDDLWCVDKHDMRIEWVAIRDYIASRDAVAEAEELEAFLIPPTAPNPTKARL